MELTSPHGGQFLGGGEGGGNLLVRLFKDKLIMIDEIRHPEMEGETLMNESVFIHIDPRTDEWRGVLDHRPAKGIAVEIYGVTRSAKDLQIFGALNRSLDELCVEESQIAKFVRVNGNEFMKNCRSTLFLVKIKEEYRVIEVRSYAGLDRYVPHMVGMRFHHILKAFDGVRCKYQIVVPTPSKK